MAGPDGQALDDSHATIGAKDGRVEGMRAVLRDMREVKDKLNPKPSLEAVEAAEKAISDIDHKLIKELEEVVSAKRPYGVEADWFIALQAMKEDRCKRDAELEKLPHIAVIELNNFHRHYEAIIAQAEASLVTGADGPVGLEAELKVGNLPRIIHYHSSGPPAGLTALSPESNPAPQPVIERHVEPQASRQIGGLSAAFNSKNSSGELASIPETAPLSAPPKLLAMIEDAAIDKREVFSIKGMFGALTWFPETIGNLTALTRLDLSGNRLKYLPPSIGNLQNLKILDLGGNRLTELPETIGNLGQLMALDFHSNQLTELPVSIGGCSELVELIGDFNKIRGLPESLGNCQSLQKINLALNELESIPRSIGNLQLLLELDLHYNQLKSLPDTLCLLTNLQKLNVAAQHASLTAIPAQIGQLSSLEDLNLGQCQIRTLPDSFVNLTSLQKLQLDGNPLHDPPLSVAEQGKDAVMEYIHHRIASRTGKSRTMDATDMDLGTSVGKRGGFFWKSGESAAGSPIVGRRKGHQTPKNSDGLGTTPKSFTPLGSAPSAPSGFWGFLPSKASGGSGNLSANQSPLRD